MRKVFVSVVMVVLVLVATANAAVENDTELHRVVGGLYSLVGAVNINDNPKPHINQLRQYFENVPNNWNNQVQLSLVNNAVWAAINVDKYSSARKFLRTNAQNMGIKEAPEGYAWLGGDYAWLKVSDVKLTTAKGTGQDSGLLFMSADDGKTWWMSQPMFTDEAADEIMRRYGVKNAPELHRPSGIHESAYDSVKPSDPKKPKDIHIGTRKSSFDMGIELGTDVILNPIPNTRRR